MPRRHWPLTVSVILLLSEILAIFVKFLFTFHTLCGILNVFFDGEKMRLEECEAWRECT